jgi:acetyl esterase/lipase
MLVREFNTKRRLAAMATRQFAAWAAVIPLMLVILPGCSHNIDQESVPVTSISSPLDADVVKRAQAGVVTFAYGPERDAEANLLDFRLPTTGKPPYPLIIYIHGGAWLSGDKNAFPSFKLLQGGYATASINYRLTDKAIFPAQIEDCKRAVAWLRSNASLLKVDPNRFGVWGASAGGHLVALLGTTNDAKSPPWATPPGTSARVQAVCDWCGPSDLLTMAEQSDPRHNVMGAVAKLLGGPPSERQGLAKEASPTTYATKGCPPFLIMHGDKDDLVPILQSKELCDALKKKGADCTFETVDGPHNFYTLEREVRVRQFFDRTFKK